MLARSEWVNLNGLWDYAVVTSLSALADEELPSTYDGQIVVPFAIETAASGVGRALLPHETLFYRRTIELPWPGRSATPRSAATTWPCRGTPTARMSASATAFTIRARPWTQGSPSSIENRSCLSSHKGVGLLMMIVLGAWQRDLLPADAIGAYQGVRLFFWVLVPMVIGPGVGSSLIQWFGTPGVINERPGMIPPAAISWTSGLVVLAALVPIGLLRQSRRSGLLAG